MKKNKVTYIQNLLEKRKRIQKSIKVMQNRLFDVQSKIDSFIIEELSKEKDNMSKPNEYLSEIEVCQMLNISKSTLYRMRMNGEIPFIKNEGRKRVMYERKEIESYMTSHKKEIEI